MQSLKPVEPNHKPEEEGKENPELETIKIDLNTVMDLKDENALQVEKNLVANIERFVTRLRMVAQSII